MRKIGITTTTGGMNRVERMKKSWSRSALTLKREYAQAAGTPSSVAITVERPATMTEFLNETARSDAPEPPRWTNTSL
jgi:hypothetical protein